MSTGREAHSPTGGETCHTVGDGVVQDGVRGSSRATLEAGPDFQSPALCFRFGVPQDSCLPHPPPWLTSRSFSPIPVSCLVEPSSLLSSN